MIIDEYFSSLRNKDSKKDVLYGGGSFTAPERHGLHSRGQVCLTNLGGSCQHSRGSWRPGVPSLANLIQLWFGHKIEQILRKKI